MLMKPLLARLLLGLFALIVTAAVPVVAETELDEITLLNGSRILGTVTAANAAELTVETDFAGTLIISAEQVASVKTTAAVTLLMADDSVIEEVPLLIEDGQFVLSGDTEYALSDLNVVNPAPWELGQGYNWSGFADAAWVLQRGNTDSDELDYKLESTWQSTRDRYTFKLRGEQDENDGKKSADSWTVLGKYDYFLEDPNYVGAQVGVESDKFADLDQRFLIGPYLGRQFYSEPVLDLSAEVGLSYVSEEFFVADDEDYAAFNWSTNATSDFLGGESRLYFDQVGIWNLEETSDVIINTTFGLAFPLLFNFEAAAEVLLEYDSGSSEVADDLDQTYRFRVGYTW